MKPVSIFPIPFECEVAAGSDLAGLIISSLSAAGLELEVGDVLVVAQKVVSKADGLVVDLSDIQPSERAYELAAELGKDARKVEVVLRESNRLVKAFRHNNQGEGTLICEHVSGHISANAGVDQSNVGSEDSVLLLPRDPDTSARNLHADLAKGHNFQFGLVISDTFGRPWRMGQVNVAIGSAGIPALKSEVGTLDSHGREMQVTMPAFADEIAAASGLVVRKTSRTPLVVVRGLQWNPDENGQARDLVRTKTEDMFR